MADQLGDRIVAEIGSHGEEASATSRLVAFLFQDDHASDLPLTAADASIANPWVGLPADIDFNVKPDHNVHPTASTDT